MNILNISKSKKIIIFFFTFLLLPFLLPNKNFSLLTASQASNSSHKIDKNKAKDSKKKSFKLKDVAGEYVLRCQSVGGVDGGKGRSVVAMGLVVFDKRGNGRVEFFLSESYAGNLGHVTLTSFDESQISYTLKITDSRRGLAVLTSNTPYGVSSGQIILRRNITSGQIIELIGISPNEGQLDIPVFTSSLIPFSFVRQNIFSSQP